MRKEIAPEQYNYNKFPGPQFHQHGEQVETESIHLTLIKDYKDAFDVTIFNQRFSEILTKYDYIVGDWGNDQLRLRGFYKDERHEAHEWKISRLQDYLLEYCNFGCGYFVLENPEPKRASFDKKSQHKKEKDRDSHNSSRRNHRSRKRQPADEATLSSKSAPNEGTKNYRSSKQETEKKKEKKTERKWDDSAGRKAFTQRERNKGRRKDRRSEKERHRRRESQTEAIQEGKQEKRHFVIRQK